MPSLSIREARPAADREGETRKPAGAGSRRSCPLGPHPGFLLDRTRLRLRVAGRVVHAALDADEVVLRLCWWCQRIHPRRSGTVVMPRTPTAQRHV